MHFENVSSLSMLLLAYLVKKLGESIVDAFFSGIIICALQSTAEGKQAMVLIQEQPCQQVYKRPQARNLSQNGYGVKVGPMSL